MSAAGGSSLGPGSRAQSDKGALPESIDPRPLGEPPRIGGPIPERMQAITIHRDAYGAPSEALALETVPTPTLDPTDAGRLLVAVLATGPNFNTNFAALGLPVPVFGRADPADIHIPGSDGVGIVVDAGAAVSGPRIGSPVLLDSWADGAIRGYETHDGFNAQFAQVDEAQAIAVPPSLQSVPPERLGALLLTFGTAYRAVVERLRVQPGDSMLVMGGGKGTSFAACQIARHLGARVILVGSNDGLMNDMVERGFAHGYLNRHSLPRESFGVLEEGEDPQTWRERTESFRDAVRRANDGRLADKVFDHTGGRNFPLLVSALSPGGALAFFGATGSGLKGEYKQTFLYDNHRFVLDARWVWMRQKQVLFRDAPPDAILEEIGLPPNRRALVWGADAYARSFAEALLHRGTSVAVFAVHSGDGADEIDALVEAGVPRHNIIDTDEFDLPTDMPDPLQEEGRPDPRYGAEFMKPARALGKRLWRLWGARISPDVVVERTDQSTLHLSTFLAKNFDENDVFPTGHVIARGPYDLSVRGSHMYGRGQAREMVRLLEDGALVMEESDLEVVELQDLPGLQQRMLDGTMTKSKGAALVQADRPGRPTADYQAAFLGESVRRSRPDESRFLDIHVQDEVAIVRIDRPAALNALSEDLLAQLDEVVKELGTAGTIEGSSVRGVVLTGTGRAFMAGADVAGFQGGTAKQVADLASEVNRVYLALERLPVTVVALVDGFAFGGGNELAMSAHYRLATPAALFAQPEVKLGIFPGYGGMQRLPRLVGPREAALLSANGEPIDARRARGLGLVDELVGSAEGLRRAFEKAKASPPLRRDWDGLGTGHLNELESLLGRKDVQEFLATPLLPETEADDVERARRAAAGRAIEAMAYGLENGFEAGLANDARLFGETVASAGGQEWIGRFLGKDPAQQTVMRILA